MSLGFPVVHTGDKGAELFTALLLLEFSIREVLNLSNLNTYNQICCLVLIADHTDETLLSLFHLKLCAMTVKIACIEIHPSVKSLSQKIPMSLEDEHSLSCF